MKTQFSLDFDISRGYRNAKSQKAFEVVAPRRVALWKRILEAIEKSGINGMTLFELHAQLKEPIHVLSGRLTEMKGKQLIADSGRERLHGTNPCTVYVSFAISTLAVNAPVESEEIRSDAEKDSQVRHGARSDF